VPFGIEAVLREVASLPKKDYQKLGLPIQLRNPNFFLKISLALQFMLR
jgi:hypothetical protein